MTIKSSVIVFIALLLNLPALCRAQTSSDEAAAHTLVSHLAKGKFEKVPESFDATMKSKLSIAQIRDGWKKTTAPLGHFLAQNKGQQVAKNGITLVVIPCKFEKGNLNIQVTYNKVHKVIGLFLAPAVEPIVSSPNGTAPPNEVAARAVIQSLSQGEYARVTERFDTTMKEKLSAAALENIWKTLTVQAGTFQKQESTRAEEIGGYEAVIVTCSFTQATIDIKVVYDASHKIAGLFFLPHKT